MNAPNFIIAGAPKCGSTTLFRYLNPHHDVFFPKIKEPGFMIKEYYQALSKDSPNYQRQLEYLVLDEKSYGQLYDEVNCKILGDSSISYLFQYENAIENILKYSGRETKILFILREPLSRLKSQYQYIVELGFENQELTKALELEEYRLSENWSSIFAYKQQGLYAQGIRAFMEAFEHVHVMFFEDLIVDPADEMDKVYEFLGISSSELGEDLTFNKSGIPRNRAVHNFLMTKNPLRTVFAKAMRSFMSEDKLLLIRDKLRGMNQRKNSGIEISDDLKQTLKAFYKEDYKELERLLGRTLPWSA
ncbi:sulfotransferase domain-containing protein [Schleiferiaceae bacterium]|nr:sulfotransferase domain-containing protein [Schleiferiaceae bacterium]